MKILKSDTQYKNLIVRKFTPEFQIGQRLYKTGEKFLRANLEEFMLEFFFISWGRLFQSLIARIFSPTHLVAMKELDSLYFLPNHLGVSIF